MQNNSMTEIIYDYFTSRILFGYYPHGDHLPSTSYICRQFQVSALTVRAVFAKMREEGYIETAERMHSTVTYQPDETKQRRYVYSILSRKEGMDDMCRSSDILFGPIARFYLQKQEEASIKQIRSQLKKRKGHPAKQITMFYAEAMQPLNNALILNLHWEMVRYLQMPYLPHAANFEDKDVQAEEHIERMLTLIEAGNTEKAVEIMQAFSSGVTYRFLQNLSATLDTKQQVKQIPFTWQIYRKRPQLCYTLAAEIMSKINKQVYKQDQYLPSCQSLAFEYGVSLITMRRTLELLGDMHVTETHNGVGTKIISGKHTGSPNFTHVQIRKSLIFFLQALQISALTCRNVAVHTLSSLKRERVRVLEQKTKRHLSDQTAFLLGGTCLEFIGENNPSAFIREVYRQLYQLLQWGHLLHMFYKKTENRNYFEAKAAGLPDALSCRDIQKFAGQLEELIAIYVGVSKKLLLELGFEEEQLI